VVNALRGGDHTAGALHEQDLLAARDGSPFERRLTSRDVRKRVAPRGGASNAGERQWWLGASHQDDHEDDDADDRGREAEKRPPATSSYGREDSVRHRNTCIRGV
jgi:hypothetical protein